MEERIERWVMTKSIHLSFVDGGLLMPAGTVIEHNLDKKVISVDGREFTWTSRSNPVNELLILKRHNWVVPYEQGENLVKEREQEEQQAVLEQERKSGSVRDFGIFESDRDQVEDKKIEGLKDEGYVDDTPVETPMISDNPEIVESHHMIDSSERFQGSGEKKDATEFTGEVVKDDGMLSADGSGHKSLNSGQMDKGNKNTVEDTAVDVSNDTFDGNIQKEESLESVSLDDIGEKAEVSSPRKSRRRGKSTTVRPRLKDI